MSCVGYCDCWQKMSPILVLTVIQWWWRSQIIRMLLLMKILIFIRWLFMFQMMVRSSWYGTLLLLRVKPKVTTDTDASDHAVWEYNRKHIIERIRVLYSWIQCWYHLAHFSFTSYHWFTECVMARLIIWQSVHCSSLLLWLNLLTDRFLFYFIDPSSFFSTDDVNIYFVAYIEGKYSLISQFRYCYCY